jgi:NAD(P)-dependent dehydrogenase (short-subunit alcohol dehydrogenase family)
MSQSNLAVSHAASEQAMCSRRALRSNPPFWSAAAPLVLRAGVVWLALIASEAMAGTLEAVDSKPEPVYELGAQKLAQSMRVYQNIAQCKAQFSGADLSRFAFNEVSRVGQSRYITVHTPETSHGDFMPKVWLITGSSRGLGHGLAEAVLAAGENLVATARNPKRLANLVARYGDQVRAVALDVTNEQAAARAVDVARETFERLDVLANNAGYGNVGPIEDTSLDEFRAQIETNLFGVINVTKAALPLMREQGAGHILQFSSIGGRIGPAGRGPYAAAKWGVEGFSEVLSKEVRPLGIKVTIIEPGGFRTDFAGSSTEIREGRPEYDSTVGRTARFQRDYNGKQPGDPVKAAAAILHIVSLSNPPLRLLLGSDAVRSVEQNDLEKMESDRRWKKLSMSTDIEAGGGQDYACT